MIKNAKERFGQSQGGTPSGHDFQQQLLENLGDILGTAYFCFMLRTPLLTQDHIIVECVTCDSERPSVVVKTYRDFILDDSQVYDGFVRK